MVVTVKSGCSTMFSAMRRPMIPNPITAVLIVISVSLDVQRDKTLQSGELQPPQTDCA